MKKLVLALLTIAILVGGPVTIFRLPRGPAETIQGEVRYQMVDPGPGLFVWLRSGFEWLWGNRGLYIVGRGRYYVSRSDWQRCWPESPYKMLDHTYHVTLHARPLLVADYGPAEVVDVQRVARTPTVTK
jgi:hypothetical protein